MSKLSVWWLVGLIALVITGCSGLAPSQPGAPPVSSQPKVSYDFRQGVQGWQVGYADYPSGEEKFYELDSGVRDLPTGIEPKGSGYYVAGNNHSDDLFMFLKRKLGPAEGVKPNTSYRLKFKIVFASNEPSECLGVGGSPGEGVTLKAGASDSEPLAVVQNGNYRMNVDKGNQAKGGPAGAALGNIANGIPCDKAMQQNKPYASVTREHTSETSIKSSAAGEVWLLVGTDSGFEALTALYYQSIDVELLPQ